MHNERGTIIHIGPGCARVIGAALWLLAFFTLAYTVIDFIG